MMVMDNPFRAMAAYVQTFGKEAPMYSGAGLCILMRQSPLDKWQCDALQRAIDRELDRRSDPVHGRQYAFLPSVLKHEPRFAALTQHEQRMLWLKEQGDAWEDWVYPSPMFKLLN